MLAVSRRGAGSKLCPLCPFSLAYLVISQTLRYQNVWLKFKDSCALRDAGGAGGTFSLERIFNADSCQGKAGPSIERSSSCMRVDHANSIEHGPSAQPSANKVIFLNLLRQKGGHTSCPCAELVTRAGPRPELGLAHSFIPDSKTWALSAIPSLPWTESAQVTVTGLWLLAEQSL